ncbi:hypothetical protein WCLP8_2880002 [uncultured Gammaproteobacteria bacterium]
MIVKAGQGAFEGAAVGLGHALVFNIFMVLMVIFRILDLLISVFKSQSMWVLRAIT